MQEREVTCKVTRVTSKDTTITKNHLDKIKSHLLVIMIQVSFIPTIEIIQNKTGSMAQRLGHLLLSQRTHV